MRNGSILTALAEHHRVNLWVVHDRASFALRAFAPRLPALCERVTPQWVEGKEEEAYRGVARDDAIRRLAAEQRSPMPYHSRHATPAVLEEARGLFEGHRFEVIHVSRMSMAPFARHFLDAPPASRPWCVLDLDELESWTRGEIASLHEQAGDHVLAAIERIEAQKYGRLEATYLPRFDEVWVASEQERDRVQDRYRHRCVRVVPNAVEILGVVGDRPPGQVFTLLFVGTFSYYPNEDAARFFCNFVLPRLRELCPRPFRLVIAGLASRERVGDLVREPEVEVTGDVDDLTEHYRSADVAVVPLRVGGGTRIKILEAFGHRRPVVATSIGAEGLDVRDGAELLLADSPDDFARACCRLMANPGLAQEVARRAFAWVSERHTPRVLGEILRPAVSRGPTAVSWPAARPRPGT